MKEDKITFKKKAVEAFLFRDSQGVDLNINLASLKIAFLDIDNPVKSEGRKEEG